MKRLCEFSLLSVSFTVLTLEPLSNQIAIAGSREVEHNKTRGAQPGLQLAQSTGSVSGSDATAALEALIREDEERRAKAKEAARQSGKATGGEQDPSVAATSAARGAISLLCLLYTF
jgi:tRNA(Ile2) C34 agmatinyltransferase TiaS